MSEDSLLHATCVAWRDRAALILGASGRGKSTLGLILLSYGCGLVADDRVLLTCQDDAVMASCPKPLEGLIEARGIGLLRSTFVVTARVNVVVDLDQTEAERLPPRRTVTLLGCEIPLICRSDGPHFAPAILQYLKAGLGEA